MLSENHSNNIVLAGSARTTEKKNVFFYISVGILSPNFHRSADNSPENTCIKRKYTKMTFFIIKNPQRSDFYRCRRIWICRTRSVSRRSGRWRLRLWSEDTTIAAPAAVDLDWSGATNRQIDGTRSWGTSGTLWWRRQNPTHMPVYPSIATHVGSDSKSGHFVHFPSLPKVHKWII